MARNSDIIRTINLLNKRLNADSPYDFWINNNSMSFYKYNDNDIFGYKSKTKITARDIISLNNFNPYETPSDVVFKGLIDSVESHAKSVEKKQHRQYAKNIGIEVDEIIGLAIDHRIETGRRTNSEIGTLSQNEFAEYEAKYGSDLPWIDPFLNPYEVIKRNGYTEKEAQRYWKARFGDNAYQTWKKKTGGIVEDEIKSEQQELGIRLEDQVLSAAKSYKYNNLQTPSEWFGTEIDSREKIDFYGGNNKLRGRERYNADISGKWDARDANSIFEVKTVRGNRFKKIRKTGQIPQEYSAQAMLYAYASGADKATVIIANQEEALDPANFIYHEIEMNDEKKAYVEQLIRNGKNVRKEIIDSGKIDINSLSDATKNALERKYDSNVDELRDRFGRYIYALQHNNEYYEYDANGYIEKILSAEDINSNLYKTAKEFIELESDEERTEFLRKLPGALGRDLSGVYKGQGTSLYRGMNKTRMKFGDNSISGFNDTFRFFYKELGAIGKIFMNGIEDGDVRGITGEGISRAAQQALSDFNLGGSEEFTWRDTLSLKAFEKSLDVDRQKKKIIRQMHRADAAAAVQKKLAGIVNGEIDEKTGRMVREGMDMSEALYSYLFDHAQNIAGDNVSIMSLWEDATTKLNSRDSEKALDVLKTLKWEADAWKTDNKIGNSQWYNKVVNMFDDAGFTQHVPLGKLDSNGKALFKRTPGIFFDPVAALADQRRRQSSLMNTILDNFITEDRLTIGDIVDIMQKGSEERKEQILRLFDNDRPVLNIKGITSSTLNANRVLTQDLNLEDGVSIDAARSSYINSYNAEEVRPRRVNLAERIVEQYERYKADEDERSLEAFSKLTINGLRKDAFGNVVVTSDIEHFVTRSISRLNDTFPFNMFKLKDVLYNNATEDAVEYFRKGSLNPVINEFLGVEGDYLEDDLLLSSGRLFKRTPVKKYGRDAIAELTSTTPEELLEDGWVEIEKARGKFRAISTTVGFGKKWRDAFYGGNPFKSVAPEDMTFLDAVREATGISIEKIVESEEKGNFTRLFTDFSGLAAQQLAQDATIVTTFAETMDAMKNVEGKAIKAWSSADVQETVRGAISSFYGINRFMDFNEKSTVEFSGSVARSLESAMERIAVNNENAVPIARAKRMLGYLNRLRGASDNEMHDLILEMTQQGLSSETTKQNYLSTRLSNTLSSYIQDEDKVMTSRYVNIDIEGLGKKGAYVKRSYNQELQKRISEEILLNLQDSFRTIEGDKLSGYADLMHFLEKNMNVQDKDMYELKDLLTNTVLNEFTGWAEKAVSQESELIDKQSEFIARYLQLTVGQDKNSMLMKNMIIDHAGSILDITKDLGEDYRREFIQRYMTDNKILVRSMQGFKTNTLAIVSDINKGHIEKAFNRIANDSMDFMSQFVAGPRNMNSASAGLWYMTYRLNEMLDDPFKAMEFTGLGTKQLGFKLNFGLDRKYLGSAGSILGNLVLRRAMPVMGTLAALDFIDDVSKNTTGMGIYEAGMSGLANNYLAIKKFTGAVGLDGALKGMTQDNAIVKYFAGFTGDENPEWKTYEEQKKYYEKGYSAIRKARFWTFGSSNEFRGGNISYFEPNTLRLLKDNPRDASLYNDSFWTKWNPERLINPYYMEKIHSEDRPYPISGAMFDPMTPWGLVLNPLIGDTLKPRVQLHSDRLSGGVDVKALISKMNADVRAKAQGNNNLFYVQNGKLRSYGFKSFNHPTWDTDIFTINNGEIYNTGDYEHYIEPRQISDSIDQHFVGQDAFAYPATNGDYANSSLAYVSNESQTTLSNSDRIAIQAAKGNPFAKLYNGMMGSSLSIIKSDNDAIRARAGYDKAQGIMIENKLGGSQVSKIEEMLNNADEISDLMNQNSKADYVHEMAVSARMLGGFYGYMAGLATGVGDNSGKRMATSADMESTSRRFWDSGIGGLGGDFMEIGRRVIPEYRRFQTVNPLMNTMPDWMPERFRFGDPFTNVPVGEMRLPGKGYEKLNPLHSDIYGRYGAFDRFKILADVAPTSAEYKLWKNIAQKTVLDPELKEEMSEIKDRVRRQTKQHEFSNYQYVGRDTSRQTATIMSVDKNGLFKIAGSDETYKLAGVRVKSNENETSTEVLQRYLTPGSKVKLVIENNMHYARNRDASNSINAAIMIEDESLGEIMKRNGDAVERKSDMSIAAVHARHSGFMNSINYLSEAFMHADIPILHNRWFNANDALEDYKDNYIYGTSFQSWTDIPGTFIMPALRKGSSSTFWMGLGIASDIIYNNLDQSQAGSKFLKELWQSYEKESGFDRRATASLIKAAKTFTRYTDRFGLMGELVGGMVKYGTGQRDWFKQSPGRRAGILIGLSYAAANNDNNLAISTMATSRLAFEVSDLFFGRNTKQNFKWAAIGAAVGAARWAASKKLLATDETANTYIPDDTRRRWELEDYFDRLEYIKYNALFEKAALKAQLQEGVDIKKILYTQHKESKELKETRRQIMDALRDLDGVSTQAAQETRIGLYKRLGELHSSSTPLTGGEYTKSAIMYYNAMQSTMYALDETSSMSDIIRALPKTEREYFMEFVQERDPEKRKEIMETASPQIRKALNMLWNQKYDKPESNESFFSSHRLPPPTWAGWNPNVDLADVKAKVINNEAGQVSSDYGIYASQYQDPDVLNAPSIGLDQGGDGWLMSSLKLQAVLNGMGLIGTEVSVEPKQDNVLDVAVNLTKIVPYQIDQAIRGIIH